MRQDFDPSQTHMEIPTRLLPHSSDLASADITHGKTGQDNPQRVMEGGFEVFLVSGAWMRSPRVTLWNQVENFYAI